MGISSVPMEKEKFDLHFKMGFSGKLSMTYFALISGFFLNANFASEVS